MMIDSRLLFWTTLYNVAPHFGRKRQINSQKIASHRQPYIEMRQTEFCLYVISALQTAEPAVSSQRYTLAPYSLTILPHPIPLSFPFFWHIALGVSHNLEPHHFLERSCVPK